MSFKTDFKNLIKQLSTDPKVREAIQSLGRMSDKRGFSSVPQGLGATLLLAGKFAGKGRLRTIIHFVDAAVFLISLSLIIKQNVFDRPEVQEFLRRVYGGVSKTSTRHIQAVRKYVNSKLTSRRSRSR